MLQRAKQWRRLLTMVLALILVLNLGLSPAMAAGENDQVRVIVENTTYPQADGAPWEGTLVDAWVDIDQSSTMMSCVVAALDTVSATQTGAEDGYISEVNGLKASDNGFESGWMGSLNDWLVNEGFPAFTVASGKLQAEDVIRIMYTSNGYGADLGGTWDNNDKSLKALSFDLGTLSPAFASTTTNYTLTVPAGTNRVTVTPTAANKNYQVRIKVGDGQYLNPGARTVEVTDGTVITVTCGDPSWPTMNGNSGDAVSYTVTVAVESAGENTPPTLAEGVAASVNAKTSADGSYSVDLSTIFTDADGDDLTYKVSVNGADPVTAAESYSYTMDGSSATLVFTANDGQSDSEDTYTVQLKKNGKPYISNNSNKTKTGTAEVNREYSFTISMFTDPDRDSMTYQVSVNGGEYVDAARSYKYTPAEIGTDVLVFRAYDGTDYSDDTCTLTLTVASNLTPITYPSDATLVLEEKNFSGYNYKYFDPVQPVSTTVDTEAGTTTNYYDLSKTASMAYRVRVTGEDCVTYANLFTKTAGYSLTVTEADLKPEGKTPSTVVHEASANNGYNVSDVFLNINAQGYLRMTAVGNSYQLVNLRNWEAVDSTTANNFVEPDYHYTVIDENGNPSANVVTVSDTGLISAVGEGTAIVLVTYDAITYPAGSSVGGTFYSALWPENTGVFVVSVGAASSGINSGMTINEGKNTTTNKLSADALDSELDVIYFLGESGEYTFTPGTAGVSVSVANPSLSGGKLSFSGFQAVGANSDGSYSVPLTTGRNIVKLEKDGKAEYQVITAKAVTVTVNNGEVVNPGDNISIVFDTLYHPANKLAGVYNMNAIALYSDVDGVEDGKLVGGSSNQYKFASTAAAQTINGVVVYKSGGWTGGSYTKESDLTVPEDWEEDSFTLSGGSIMAFGFGDPYGNHRAITYTTGKDPNMSASTRTAYMGKLPDIVIPIGEQAQNTAPTLAAGVEETEALSMANSETYKVDLDDIFTDAEEDDLTYTVVVNGADAVDAQANYSYPLESNGTVTFVFTANDGQLDSDKTYTVTLTVKDPVTIEITASVSKYGEFVSDKNGDLLVQQPVSLSGKLNYNLDDAFTAIHEAYYPGGSAAGYATSETQWGTSVAKFWNDTSYNIGYQIDHGDVYVIGLSTAVVDGNEVEAYILQSNWPDSEPYVAFDKSEATVFAGDTLDLTLSKQDYDDNLMPVMVPYTDGADITVDGQTNGSVTNASGKVSLSFDQPGTYLVSAKDTKTVNGETVTAITAPSCIVTVNAVSTAKVDFTSQLSGAFLHAPQFGVDVTSNLAESYGYTDSVDGVSVLDVLVKAHEITFEDDFTADTAESYLTISASSGSPTKQFGVGSSTYYGGFFLNHAMANDGTMFDQNNYNATTVGTQAVVDGDLVEFFFYEDPYWGDSYNWFLDEEGQYSREFNAVAGEDLDLVMKSFYAMSCSLFKDAAEMVAASQPSEVDSAQIYIVNPQTGALTAMNGAEVEDGDVTLNFAEPGEYIITAYGTDDSMFMQLMTLTTVIVAEPENTPPALADGVEASVTATIPADGSYTVNLSTIFTDADGDELTYKVSVNGADPVTADENYSFTPEGGSATLVFTANDGKADSPTYTVTVTVTPSDNGSCLFTVTPSDAALQLFDNTGAPVQPDATNPKLFTGLTVGEEYTYTASKYGYITVSGSLTAAPDGAVNLTLAQASAGPDEVSAYWKNFRNSDVNMAITDTLTPTSADTATQLWSKKFGSGWSETPSPQLIVDDSLIVMCGTKLYKLDLTSGEVKAQASMVASPSFSYTPPTYGEGMIFCPLDGGRIQAFNASTLESLWVYTDSLGGQALSPITYSDGYIYTGFWNGETADAAYVCVSVTDEDTTKPDEAKASAWRDVVQGGFYWSGSVVVGDYVVYGTDNGVNDGANGAGAGAHLLSRHKTSGALAGSLELNGDQRSSIAYADGRVYCTTKGGGLYSAAVDTTTGALSNLKNNNFGAQSTSTPVVYKGRVYLGCGSGITATGSNGNLLVCDANSLDTLFAVGLQGYPQCSMLLSTAYESSEGFVYLYSTYNNNPGGVSLIKLKPNATTASDAELIEVFTPEAKNYCICSVICGPDGTLYYKNDSGNIFAVQDQFTITAESNGHGDITVKNGDNEVAKAPAGTALSVTVTANAGWELKELTLNGEKLTVSGNPETGYTASFTMPAQTAQLVASYTQNTGEVEVVEAPAEGKLSEAVSNSAALTDEQKAAVLAAAQNAASTGLPTAADGLVRSLISANPDKEIKIVLYLAVEVVEVKTESNAITELTLDISPYYALYLDGADEPAEINIIPNSEIKRPVTVSLSVPTGMTVNEHTRILHKGAYIKPTLANGKLTFSVSGFSTFTVLADARIASVTFDPDGGKLNGSTGRTSIDYYPADEGMALPTPSRDGYVFKGWYSKANGEGIKYSNVSATLPDRLYACWQPSSNITVSFRLIGDGKHSDGVDGHSKYLTWIATTSYTLPAGSTVYDLFIEAIYDAGLSQKGAAANYVSSIKAPAEFGGYWLSEFDNGHNSGWMYTVNGTHPDQGLRNCVLEDGDKVIWHYVDDYTQESESKWNGGSPKYLNRWLEAEDISPAQYIKKYGNISLILQVGSGGTVSPNGEKLSDYLGKDVTFTITPDTGYRVKDVLVDGKSVGAVTSYTYKNLTVDSRIVVSFEKVTAFPDVPASHWAYNQISALAARGVINGYPNGYFYPESKITRADFVVMLSRLSGQSLPAYSGRFKDVTADKYYAQAVTWAADAKITVGYGNDTFRPDALISRQEMAAMLYRYADYMKISLPAGSAASFTDSASIDEYAREPVAAMNRAGVINGYPDGSFRPAGNASRAEAAKMMYVLDSLK